MQNHETIVILDFGGQYTQLIGRRIRELGVYSEIVPFNSSWEMISARFPKGIILSGGPDSVLEESSPSPDPNLFSTEAPILGICYGMQLMADRLGGRVTPNSQHEYGHTDLTVEAGDGLFEDVPSPTTVWMSHGDHIERVPEGFKVLARSKSLVAAMGDSKAGRFGVQFHPEVVHTLEGTRILENFVKKLCGCKGDWTPGSFVGESVRRIRDQVGPEKAICGLSGGVDSSVAALLVHRAIAQRLTCIFVDNGLLRKNEFQEVLGAFKRLELNVVGVDASARFLSRLQGVLDPEKKRKIIGEEFIRVFEETAGRIGNVRFLVQGTLYPDVIESVSVKGPSAVIKSHHNVGGLPEKMDLELVEPLRELFKDEVRRVGRELGLQEHFINRQPFPGPGLAVRIIGAVTPERLAMLREADAVVQDEIEQAGLYEKIWQSFAVLLPVQTVGVMGDDRTYDNVVAIRAVHSQDGMTADWVDLPNALLRKISSRIVNEVSGINRVVYDISSKPPSTIEWE